ncbi:F-box/kelch-repeat protein At3g06240-like [Vicia villosa]|uniref:F-box/kelch-repeat protein At3g06240-like n=1 Tax=Vicia villosa TaxID=3911 RepID=UPI00273BFBEB|nr:F-box/kelch-repeat protein At3g06240-like [Vicia villosa]XP_058761574.1 F-box/kelch-repeat protein At3g06240-like [Vicia villosa]
MATQPPKLLYHHRKSNPSTPPILPNELITDILSRFTVKYLMQMKCVSKSWNTLISDPIFIKIHLNRSELNPQFSLISSHNDDHSFVPFPVGLLWKNSSINIPQDPSYQLSNKNCTEIVGSCNGLVCLAGYSLNEITRYKKIWLRFWNPATRAISDKLGSFFYYDRYRFEYCKFTFGYDNSTQTYKVTALGSVVDRTLSETDVKVFSLGDNVWRTIHGVPAIPLQLYFGHEYDGVHLSNTINWLSIQDVFGRDDIVEQFVIISLDLSTETFTQLMPPENYDNHGGISPNICVMMDSLCFSYDKETEIFIWQMTKFGDEKSWSQFLKFSYHNVGVDYELGHPYIKLTPLHLSEDGDTLLLAKDEQDSAILYNRRNNIAKKTRINNKICWFSIRAYVESLVPTC